MRTFHATALILLGSIAFATPALAGTDTDNLNVTASVENSCVITGGTLAFGVYDTVSGAAVNASTSINVECTAGAITTITLGEGANEDTGSTPAAPARRLYDGDASFLSYSLYSDAGRTTAWGDTAETGKGYTAITAEAAALTVYGRVAANQDVPAGSYTDTVVATVTF
jgi:spore coat protein U-like protein